MKRVPFEVCRIVAKHKPRPENTVGRENYLQWEYREKAKVGMHVVSKFNETYRIAAIEDGCYFLHPIAWWARDSDMAFAEMKPVEE